MGEADTFRLWYWPGIKGRGEYVRLCFEEAGEKYTDIAQELPPDEGQDAVVGFFFRGAAPQPVRAPPAIQKGNFVLCNTGTIMNYLGNRFGWHAHLSGEQKAQVESIIGIVVGDGVGEGRLAFHPKNFYASHREQVAESEPYIRQYGEERLPKYFGYIERLLSANAATIEQGFIIGPSLTAADIGCYHFMCAAEKHYHKYYHQIDAPLAKAHQNRISNRPNIKAYLESKRCPPWDTDSMM